MFQKIKIASCFQPAAMTDEGMIPVEDADLITSFHFLDSYKFRCCKTNEKTYV